MAVLRFFSSSFRRFFFFLVCSSPNAVQNRFARPYVFRRWFRRRWNRRCNRNGFVGTVSGGDKGSPSRVEGEGRVGCGPRGKACAVPTTVHGPWTFATWTAAPLESQKEVTEAERERGEKELFNKMSTKKKKTKKTVLSLFFLFAVQSLPNSPPPTALSKQLQWPSTRRLLCA